MRVCIRGWLKPCSCFAVLKPSPFSPCCCLRGWRGRSHGCSGGRRLLPPDAVHKKRFELAWGKLCLKLTDCETEGSNGGVEDGALGGEEFVDALFGVVEHLA